MGNMRVCPDPATDHPPTVTHLQDCPSCLQWVIDLHTNQTDDYRRIQRITQLRAQRKTYT